MTEIRKRERPAQASRDEINEMGDRLKALLHPSERRIEVTFGINAPDPDCYNGSVKVTLHVSGLDQPVSYHAEHLYDALYAVRNKVTETRAKKAKKDAEQKEAS